MLCVSTIVTYVGIATTIMVSIVIQYYIHTYLCRNTAQPIASLITYIVYSKVNDYMLLKNIWLYSILMYQTFLSIYTIVYYEQPVYVENFTCKIISLSTMLLCEAIELLCVCDSTTCYCI